MNGLHGGSGCGGGSGGSIYIRTRGLEGSGVVSVRGGNGGSYGGGGSVGRIAVLWQDREWWYGSLQAYGGTGYANGGAGTVYMQVRRGYE